MVEGDGADGPDAGGPAGGRHARTSVSIGGPGLPSGDNVRGMDGALDLAGRPGRAVRLVASVFLLVSGEPGRVQAPATGHMH